MRDEFRTRVEERLTAEFGAERDAERVAERAAELRRAEDVDWSPSFVAAKLTDAPKEYSVPRKWNWWLDETPYLRDLDDYRFEE